MSDSPGDGLHSYALIWAMQQALILHASGLAYSLQSALVAATVLTSAWPPMLCCALAARVHANLMPWPHGWESHYWCATTDLTLLLALVAHMAKHGSLSLLPGEARSAALYDASRVSRYQVGFYYLSAALFKFNTSFLDHRYSCASPYVAQLLTAYLPQALATPASLEPFLIVAPAHVLVGELLLSFALLRAAAGRGGGAAALFGVSLALLLHLGIALTPPPNNIGAFSVIMACRLAHFAHPHALARALRPRTTAAGHVGTAATLAIAAVATAATSAATAGSAADGAAGQMSIMFFAGVDWSVPTFVLMAAVVLRAVATPVAQHEHERRLDEKLSSAVFAKVLGPAMLLVAFVHSFVGPPSGLQDLGGSNMYSNLRTLGGGNHYFLPTNLLRLSGGVVRVEACNSTSLNALYPGEISSAFHPRAAEALKASGHSGRQWNWGMGRVLGAWALPPPPPGAPFVRYTVPSLQLRRMLEEVRASGEAFALEYTELDGAFGDEQWRIGSAGARRVRVSSERGCVVLSEEGAPPCGDDALANRPLRPWERALGAWSPHPIVEDMAEEMHCFGP